MPQLGMGMSEGTIAEWNAKEGEHISREQLLASVETEKVVTELPSPYAGFVHIVVGSGATVPTETLIAQIADTETEYTRLTGIASSGRCEPVPSIAAAPVLARQTATGRIRVSGLARKLARENGIDLASIAGTGPMGRVVKRDLAAVLANARAAAATPVHPSGIREKARIPLTGMRRTIGERMTKSKTIAPHTHIVFEIDVTKLMALRQAQREREKDLGTRVSMTAIYARALALACRQVPICNAALIDGEIVVWDEVNVAIGVALPGRNEYDSGLVAPVVRNVETKGLQEIDREIRELVARAREGKLSVQDMADATITMSSSERLNSGGWMVGTPLLTLPQVVAFGPGAPVPKPVVRDDGQIVAGSILPCCLTFDHRALDGEPAARLAKNLTDLLGQPELMLL
jgi:pyruvate/2-oxoglutarate dehydrogenase complex dihydrolipoamide acyltransferase (E2) component